MVIVTSSVMADLQKVFDQLYSCLVHQDISKPRPRDAEPTRETGKKLPPELQINGRGYPAPPWLSAYQTVGNRNQSQCCRSLSPDYNQNTPKCRGSPDKSENTAQNTCSLGHRQNMLLSRGSPDGRQSTAQNTCSPGHRENTLQISGVLDHRQNKASSTCGYNLKQNTAHGKGSPDRIQNTERIKCWLNHKQNIEQIKGSPDHGQNTASSACSYDLKQNTSQVKGSPDHRQNTESGKCKLDHKQNAAQIKGSPDHIHNTERMKYWLNHKQNAEQTKSSPDYRQDTEMRKCRLDHKQNTALVNGQLDHKRNTTKYGKNHLENTIKITCVPDHWQNSTSNTHSPDRIQTSASVVKIQYSPGQRQEPVKITCSPDHRQKTAKNSGSPGHKQNEARITHGPNQRQGTTNPDPKQNTANMTDSTKYKQNTGRITRSRTQKQNTVSSSVNTEPEPVTSAVGCNTVTLQDCKQGACGDDSDTASDKSGYTENSGTGSKRSRDRRKCSSKPVRKKTNTNTSADSVLKTEKITRSKGELKSIEEHTKSGDAKLNEITKVNRPGDGESDKNVKTGVSNKANLQVSRSCCVANAKCTRINQCHGKNKTMPTKVNRSFDATAEDTEAGNICDITTEKTSETEEPSNAVLESGPQHPKRDKSKKSNRSDNVIGLKDMGINQVIPVTSGKNARAHRNLDWSSGGTARDAPIVANTSCENTKSNSSPKAKNSKTCMNMICNMVNKPAETKQTVDVIGNTITGTNRSCDVKMDKNRETNRSCDVTVDKNRETNRSCDVTVDKNRETNRSCDVRTNKTRKTNKTCDVTVNKSTDANRSSDVIMNKSIETDSSCDVNANKSVIKNASCEKIKDRKGKANTPSSVIHKSFDNDKEKLATAGVIGALKIATVSCMDNNISKVSTEQNVKIPSSPCRKRMRLCFNKSRQHTGVGRCGASLSETGEDTHPRDNPMTDQSKLRDHPTVKGNRKTRGDTKEQRDEESDAASDESGYHMESKKIAGKGAPMKNGSSSNRVHVNSKKRKRTTSNDVTSAQPTSTSSIIDMSVGQLSQKARVPVSTVPSQEKTTAKPLMKQNNEKNTSKQLQTQNDRKNAPSLSPDNIQMKSKGKTSHKVDQAKERISTDVARKPDDNAEEHQDEVADAASDVSGYCVKSKNKGDRKQNVKRLDGSKEHSSQRIKVKEQRGIPSIRGVDNNRHCQKNSNGLPSKVKKAIHRNQYGSVKGRDSSCSARKKHNLQKNNSTSNYRKCSNGKSKKNKQISASVKHCFHKTPKKKRRRSSGSVCSDNSTRKTCKKKRLGSGVSGHISHSQSQKKEPSKKSTKCGLINRSKSQNPAKRGPKRGSQSKTGTGKRECMKDKTGGNTDVKLSPIKDVVNKKAEVELWVRESVQQTLAYSHQDYPAESLVSGDPIGLFSLNHPGGIWKNVASDS